MSHSVHINGSNYHVRVWRDRDEISKILAEHRNLHVLTPFQTHVWLDSTYEHLLAKSGAQPCLVGIESDRSGKIDMLIPLALVREKNQCIAGFPNFGVADYGAGLISRSSIDSFSMQDFRHIWRAVARALDGVDRLSLKNMPLAVNAIANPLAQLPGVFPSSHKRFVVTCDTTVQNFIHERGKKYRKEVERCYRLLDATGDWTFKPAETEDEKLYSFTILEWMQNGRRALKSGDYKLQSCDISMFYRSTLTGCDKPNIPSCGQARVFSLKSGQTPIALIYGMETESTFTLLRIASESGQWQRLSPGRLIVLETMRYYLDRGIHIFDLGIGDYKFKRGLGAKPYPLVDAEFALTLSAWPTVMLMQAKGWLKQRPYLMKTMQAARQKMASKAVKHPG